MIARTRGSYRNGSVLLTELRGVRIFREREVNGKAAGRPTRAIRC